MEEGREAREGSGKRVGRNAKVVVRVGSTGERVRVAVVFSEVLYVDIKSMRDFARIHLLLNIRSPGDTAQYPAIVDKYIYI